ncbi:glycosyltransferase [Echinicola sp. CAU 1574]|uniref:Glycosyltransferase n=1 Tax=Echinicola arenosa TaxID=2774144 RepID=A0ABR9AHR7_9BACT|nr:glycosyltransferase [Echinicola arenosa]MBD8488384.1 glycosyltransferase [Echinicola arenosa]
MAQVLVITPVKNSIETTLETAKAIKASSVPVVHKIFNDFSTPETKAALDKYAPEIGYELIHLEEVTDTPSPNYKLVLQMAQKEALKKGLPLLVVESDVTVEKDTIEKMLDFYQKNEKVGLIGAITVDYDKKVNFPYLKFKDIKDNIIDTKRSLSFCCTLFSKEFLEEYDFMALDDAKDWYDTFISKKALELEYKNYVLMNVPVLHKPHGSRPWKQLKYKNPLKYYFLKFWKGLDKI